MQRHEASATRSRAFTAREFNNFVCALKNGQKNYSFVFVLFLLY
jgi:hypothetical protein